MYPDISPFIHHRRYTSTTATPPATFLGVPSIHKTPVIFTLRYKVTLPAKSTIEQGVDTGYTPAHPGASVLETDCGSALGWSKGLHRIDLCSVD